MPLKAGKLETSTIVIVVIFIAVLVFVIAWAVPNLTKGGGLLSKGLESVAEPGRPDITLSVTCTSSKDTAGPTKDIATHSVLQYSVRNSGEAPVKSGFNVIVNRKGATGELTPLATTKIPSLDKGKSQTLKYPASGSATKGTYVVIVDQENNIIEASEINNQDQDDCAGNTLINCFTKLPVAATSTYFCPAECVSETARQGFSCNGCESPRQIGPDDFCADSCGCLCPAKTPGYNKAAHHQVAPSEPCGGLLLPDLVASEIGNRVGDKVTVTVKNSGTASAASSKLCVKTVKADGKEENSEKGVPALAIGGRARFDFGGIKAGYSLTAEVDCKKTVIELNEGNNINTKQF